ncbi:MAG: hypothetical protein R3A44_28335 [Caldilineaceae bacterium]
MNSDRPYRSQLFTVRLWFEPGVPRPGELRFKVQHVLSGEVRYFRDWPALMAFIVSAAQIDEDAPSGSHLPGDDKGIE